MCRLDPETYLRDVLARIADRPINRIGDLIPWKRRSRPADDNHPLSTVVTIMPLP